MNGSHANEKTYTFDKVFGPDTDQDLIFQEVAENMVFAGLDNSR